MGLNACSGLLSAGIQDAVLCVRSVALLHGSWLEMLRGCGCFGSKDAMLLFT